MEQADIIGISRIPRIDIAKAEVNIAARLIAYYCSQGWQNYFIHPLMLGDSWASWKRESQELALDGPSLIRGFLSIWKATSIETFYTVALIRYLRSFKKEQQIKIIEVLKEKYGFNSR